MIKRRAASCPAALFSCQVLQTNQVQRRKPGRTGRNLYCGINMNQRRTALKEPGNGQKRKGLENLKKPDVPVICP